MVPAYLVNTPRYRPKISEQINLVKARTNSKGGLERPFDACAGLWKTALNLHPNPHKTSPPFPMMQAEWIHFKPNVDQPYGCSARMLALHYQSFLIFLDSQVSVKIAPCQIDMASRTFACFWPSISQFILVKYDWFCAPFRRTLSHFSFAPLRSIPFHVSWNCVFALHWASGGTKIAKLNLISNIFSLSSNPDIDSPSNWS